LGVTVVDVAKEAGVSAMTVSRALNKPDSVPAATVARVKDAASRLGYVRNLMAAGLRANRSNLVAALVPTLSGPVFLDTLEALTRGLAGRGYHLIVGQTGYGGDGTASFLADLISRRPDGVVLIGTALTDSDRSLLRSSKIPAVELWDLAAEPVDMLIGFSHEAVGAAVADFLVQLGRRRLAFIGANDARSLRRWQSFRHRALEAGLVEPVAHLVSAPALLGDGRRALVELCAASGPFDGAFCSSDMLASGVLMEAGARGMKVPSDVAVVGFGDLNFAADLRPSLTSVRIDGPRIGELAAHALVMRMQGKSIENRVIDVGFEIVSRASTHGGSAPATA
jgi:LacI family transcriptional regulator, gluconate utilization system Gnt-I transcriptional repressor